MNVPIRRTGGHKLNEPAKSAELHDTLIRQLAAAVGPDLAAMPRAEDADLPRDQAIKRLRAAGVDVNHATVRALNDAQLNDLIRQHEALVAAGLRLPSGQPLPRSGAGGRSAVKTPFSQPAEDGSQVSQKYPGGRVRTFSATMTAGDKVRAAADQARRLRQ